MTKWRLCEVVQVALDLGERSEFSVLSLLKWAAPDKSLPLEASAMTGCISG